MKVLHIEDRVEIFHFVKHICQDIMDVEFAISLAEAKARLTKGGIDVLLVDLNLDDSSGINTVKELLPYNLPMIVLTGEPTGRFVDEALSLGVADYIDKMRLHKIDIATKLMFAYEKSAKLRRMSGRKLSFGNIDALKPYISCQQFLVVKQPYISAA